MKPINMLLLRMLISGVIGLVLGWAISYSFFSVQEGQRGVLTRGGQLHVLAPGLHFTWPWQQPTYVTVNAQTMTFAVPLSGSDNNLNAIVLWNVADVPAFVKSGDSSDQVLIIVKGETVKLVTPAFLKATSSPENLAAAVLNGLQQDTVLRGHGVAIQQVWVNAISPDDASQAKIFTTMKGLAASIGDSIVQSGQAQAEQIRNTAEQGFLQSQSAALAEAANIIGQGNSAAVKTMAPLYHQNPTLFKAYVDAKANLLKSEA